MHPYRTNLWWKNSEVRDQELGARSQEEVWILDFDSLPGEISWLKRYVEIHFRMMFLQRFEQLI